MTNINIKYENTYFYEENKFSKNIKKILPPNFRNCVYHSPIELFYDFSNKWDMLVYESGDFFARHIDGKANNRHYCKLLLFPPKKLMDYEGGELVLYDVTKKIIITSDVDKWIMVGFPINVEHESLPIISDKKIIFKTGYEIPKEIYNFFKESEFKINSMDDLNEITNPNDYILQIEELTNKLSKTKMEILQLKNMKKEVEEKLSKMKIEKIKISKSIIQVETKV